MKKILLLIIVLFCLTGCSLDYEINFDYNNINEKISAEIDGDIYEIANTIDGDGLYLEKELVEEKTPALKGFKDYYNKSIKVIGNKSQVLLNYKYQYDNFKDSYLIDRCFEESYVKNTDDYIYVSLGGNFKCFKDDDITIKVSSKYDVVKHNADKYKDGYYLWDIKMSDEENNIELYISKEIPKEEKDNLSTLKIVLIVIFIIVGITIYLLKKKTNN